MPRGVVHDEHPTPTFARVARDRSIPAWTGARRPPRQPFPHAHNCQIKDRLRQQSRDRCGPDVLHLDRVIIQDPADVRGQCARKVRPVVRNRDQPHGPVLQTQSRRCEVEHDSESASPIPCLTSATPCAARGGRRGTGRCGATGQDTVAATASSALAWIWTSAGVEHVRQLDQDRAAAERVVDRAPHEPHRAVAAALQRPEPGQRLVLPRRRRRCARTAHPAVVLVVPDRQRRPGGEREVVHGLLLGLARRPPVRVGAIGQEAGVERRGRRGSWWGRPTA